MYPTNGISTHHSSVQLRCRLHYCGEKLSGPPPTFWNDPPKKWGILKKCGGPKKNMLTALAKIGPTHLQTLGDAHANMPTFFILICIIDL